MYITFLLDPHSLVEGAISLIFPFITFSDDSTAVGDTISIDLSIKKKGISSLK